MTYLDDHVDIAKEQCNLTEIVENSECRVVVPWLWGPHVSHRQAPEDIKNDKDEIDKHQLEKYTRIKDRNCNKTYSLSRPRNFLGICSLDHVVTKKTECKIIITPNDACESSDTSHGEEKVFHDVDRAALRKFLDLRNEIRIATLTGFHFFEFLIKIY